MVGYMFCCCFLFSYLFSYFIVLMIPVNIYPTFLRQFFLGLVELWLQMIRQKLVFRSFKERCQGNQFLPRDAVHPRY